MELSYEEGKFFFRCKFAHNHFAERLDSRWNKKRKCWLVYDAKMNRDLLRGMDFEKITPKAKEKLDQEEEVAMSEVKYIYKTEPLEFQGPATKKMLSLPYCALFAPVGSGKSKITVDVLQSLWAAGEIDRIFIIGMVSINENWRDEIKKHWKGEPPWDFIDITGIESYSQGGQYQKTLAKVTKDSVVIVDESHNIKNPKAIRTEKLVTIGEKAKYRYILTGTAVLNGDIDLFSQYLFLHPDIIGIKTFVGFRNRYCIMGGYQGKKIIGYKHKQEMMDNLRPYSFVIDIKEAMPFLPKQTFTTRELSMTGDQKRVITKLKKELLSESIDGDKVVQNILTQMLRISQVAGGFTEDGEPVGKTNPKLQELQGIIKESPDEPIVIFCRFLPEIAMIMENIPDCEAIYGGIKPKQRHQIVQDFQAGKFKYLVCQYQSGATGLNMHAARICVMFSFDFSLKMWLQSIGRIARMQQTRPMLYIAMLMKGTVDHKTYRALQNKEDIADIIREALIADRLEDLF